MKETKKLVFPLVLAIGLLVFYPAPGRAPVSGSLVLGASTKVSRDFPVATDRDRGPEAVANVEDLQIDAVVVLVRDSSTGLRMFSKNSEKIYPIASLTKLMTALVVKESGKLDDIVEIIAGDEKVSEFRAGFVPGEKLYISDLLKAMLISSANDAAYVLGRYVGGDIQSFAHLMNQKAKRLGMLNTSFTNPAGFDDPKHFSTAVDLALLVDEFLLQTDLTEITAMKQSVIASIDGVQTHRLINTNRLLEKDPEIVGLKTGYTYEARGNLIALVNHAGDQPDEKHVFYSIIMGSDNRESDSLKVVNWVRKNFVWPGSRSLSSSEPK